MDFLSIVFYFIYYSIYSFICLFIYLFINLFIHLFIFFFFILLYYFVAELTEISKTLEEQVLYWQVNCPFPMSNRDVSFLANLWLLLCGRFLVFFM